MMTIRTLLGGALAFACIAGAHWAVPSQEDHLLILAALFFGCIGFMRTTKIK